MWQQAFQAFDREQMREWLGLTLDQIEQAVTDLRVRATFCDDTGDFYDLIRRAKAEAWNSLRGDAASGDGVTAWRRTS